MMKAVAAFIAVVGLVSADPVWKTNFDLVDYANMHMYGAFQEWSIEYSKEYETAEETKRFANFVHNAQRIARWNSDQEKSSTVALNKFADLTDEEFRYRVHGKNGQCFAGMAAEKRPTILNRLKSKVTGKNDVKANPSSVDWTEGNYVSPVKNQGQCGSCWSFSATGSIECNTAIATGATFGADGSGVTLSEQQLVDCSHLEGNLGCDGGQMDAAFKYVEKEGGLCSESEYPYKAEGGSCEASSCGTKYSPISSYTDVKTDSEADLETAVASGCVSVAIEADQFAFQYYSGGVLDGTCGTSLDHGVLAVGYGTDSGSEYWKVKNSWGSDWGEDGYVRICKECDKNGSKGECGIAMDPSYVTI